MSRLLRSYVLRKVSVRFLGCQAAVRAPGYCPCRVSNKFRGDCAEGAALMRHLLGEVGIQTYPAASGPDCAIAAHHHPQVAKARRAPARLSGRLDEMERLCIQLGL